MDERQTYYTVKQVAELAGVTVKTLHHYHKLKLLVPSKTSLAGYRLYSTDDLERLQHILFYRELDLSLKQILILLKNEAERIPILQKQRKLLLQKKERFDQILKTIDASIFHAERKEIMEPNSMFSGLNQAEWTKALRQQNDYLKEKYNHELTVKDESEAKLLNESAKEAVSFNNGMKECLINKVDVHNAVVQELVSSHVNFLAKTVVGINAQRFYEQVQFLVSDEFHRNMLESEQLGLAYYMLAAADAYRETKETA
jgi:DNA-binding transcriptional MerR regulator